MGQLGGTLRCVAAGRMERKIEPISREKFIYEEPACTFSTPVVDLVAQRKQRRAIGETQLHFHFGG